MPYKSSDIPYEMFYSAMSADTANHQKLCGNLALPQNFHTWKLNEIMVLSAVGNTPNMQSNN